MRRQVTEPTGQSTGNRNRRALRGVLRHGPNMVVPLTWEELQASGNLGLRVVTKTTNLLQSHGQSRSDWAKGQPLYNNYLKQHRFFTLRRLQAEIIEVVTARNLELETLDRRLRGHKQAVKFKQALNKRWTALNNVVKAFNREIDSLSRMGFPQVELPRKLTVEGLKATGILYDEMWDLDRLSVKEDWAVFVKVRNGIDAMFRCNRAEEEKELLRIEAERILHWLESQVTILLELSKDVHNHGAEAMNAAIRIPKHVLQKFLMERLRMAKSFIGKGKAKPNMNSPGDILLLGEGLQQRYQGKFLRLYSYCAVI